MKNGEAKLFDTEKSEFDYPKKLLEDGALKYELALSREAIGKIEEGTEHQELRAKEFQERFWAMAEGSFSFFKAIEASRSKLG